MRPYLKASLVALSLLIAGVLVSPSAQVSIQRGFGPTISAGSGGATAGISSVLTVSTTSAQTDANLLEKDLWTYSLPANTLSSDNYGLLIRAEGSFASNANTKQIRIYFGATAVVDTTARSVNGNGWWIEARVFRIGSSAQIGLGNYANNVTSAFVVAPTSPAENTTAAITVKVTGQNGTATAGDILLRLATVDFIRAGA